MVKFPSVAVVILNWNGRDYLEKFLPPLLISNYENLEIIVADNFSTDGSVQFIREHFPGVRVILNQENEGFAKGYNTALEQVEAKYYVLLNSDVLVTPNWITPVVSLLESDDRIGACQPKILSYKHRNLFEYAGACGGWLDSLGYPFCRGRVFDFCETDTGQYNRTQNIFWASGAALFIRSAVYHKTGGFDKEFFAHQEEIDLCWRIQRAGYKIASQPASTVYHVGGGTLPMGSSLKVFLNFRNNLMLLSKNLRRDEAAYKIPLRITLDVAAALHALLKGDSRTCRSIFRAHGHYFVWLFKMNKQKKLPRMKMSEMAGVYSGSIIWQYFFRHKKTFSEIVKRKE